MLDDDARRAKLGAPSRGSSFSIENLLGSTRSGALAEVRPGRLDGGWCATAPRSESLALPGVHLFPSFVNFWL